MSDETPRLKLAQLVSMQEMNNVTWNESLARLDGLVDLCLLGRYVNDPPAAPADGDAYLTGGAPTGAWNGYAYKIAACLDGAWRFYTPFNGLRAYVGDTLVVYRDGSWTAIASTDFATRSGAETLSNKTFSGTTAFPGGSRVAADGAAQFADFVFPDGIVTDVNSTNGRSLLPFMLGSYADMFAFKTVQNLEYDTDGHGSWVSGTPSDARVLFDGSQATNLVVDPAFYKGLRVTVQAGSWLAAQLLAIEQQWATPGGPAPFTLKVEASSDLSAWTTIKDTTQLTPQDSSASCNYYVSVPGHTSRTYWRITFERTDSGTQNFVIFNVQLFSNTNMGSGYFRGMPFKTAWDKSLTFNGSLLFASAACDIGSASYPVQNGWIENAWTVTSDETLKDEIAALSEAEMAVAKEIAPLIVVYKMKAAVAAKGSAAARKHCGWIAQQIEKIFRKNGLDPFEYGCVGFDPAVKTVTRTRLVRDAQGNAVGQPYEEQEPDCDENGEQKTVYNIRPDELAAFALAGLAARIAALEER